MFTNYQLDLGATGCQPQATLPPLGGLKQLTARLVVSYPAHTESSDTTDQPTTQPAPGTVPLQAPQYSCDQMKESAELAHARGQYHYAEQLWLLLLREFNTALPPRAVAQIFECLALSLQHQKQYGRAELFLRSAANIKRRLYGMFSVETAAAFENLAALYSVQGRYGAAQCVLEQVLCIYERTVGSRTSIVADTAAALARMYVAQDMLAQAEPMYIKALMIRTNAGINSPETDSLLEDYRMFLELSGKSKLRVVQQQQKAERPKLPSVRRLHPVARPSSTQNLPRVVGLA